MKAYVEKLKYTLSINTIFWVMFGMIGPLEIYSGNTVEFEFGFNDFFWMFLGGYFLVWLAGSAIISLFPEKVVRIINTILAILGVEFYLQNMLFNKQLIRPDGGRMDWDKLSGYTLTNTILWVVIAVILCAISIILKDKLKKISIYTMLFLSLIQMVAVVTVALQVPKDRSYENELRIDAREQFKVGEAENIIIFIVDRYPNDQFNENLSECPEMLTVLKDFTYYNNANSIFQNTAYALPIFLAGQLPDDSNDDWRRVVWTSDKTKAFYDLLHKNGYQCVINTNEIPAFGDISMLMDKYDNVRSLPATFDRGLLFRLLTKMTIYKYSPYIIKPKFEVLTYSFTDVIAAESYFETTYDNYAVYQKLINEGISVDEDVEKMFNVQHIFGFHGGYNIDENALKVPESETNSYKVRKGLNLIIEEYVNQLKQTGKYDNATIFIMSDHGDSAGEFGLQPLFLMKRAGETHDSLNIEDAPISYLDFIPTILDIIGEDYSEYGSGSTFDNWYGVNERERKIYLEDKEYTYYHDGQELYNIVYGE